MSSWGVRTPRLAAQVRRESTPRPYGRGGMRACPRRKPKGACGSPNRGFSTPRSPGERGAMEGSNQPDGIGGWLLLVALQTAVAAVASAIDAARIYQGLESPRFAEIIIYTATALLVGGIAFGLNIATLVALFSRSRRFPAIFIACLLWRMAKNIFEIWALGQVSPTEWINPAPLIVSTVFAVVWIFYVARSKRVSNTFTAGPKQNGGALDAPPSNHLYLGVNPPDGRPL